MKVKFRAFDLNKEKMISHEQLFAMDCSNEYPFLALLMGYCETYMEPLKVKIMQFTGTHDKHTTEIYKGDIVIAYDLFGNNPEICQVIWDNTTCAFRLYSEEAKPIKSLHKFHNHLYEVIGNIHENPELLRVSKEEIKKLEK